MRYLIPYGLCVSPTATANVNVVASENFTVTFPATVHTMFSIRPGVKTVLSLGVMAADDVIGFSELIMLPDESALYPGCISLVLDCEAVPCLGSEAARNSTNPRI